MKRTLIFGGSVFLVACASTPDRAVWSTPWPVAEQVDTVETLAIEPLGGWFDRDEGWQMGPYTLQPVGRSWWDGVPGYSGFSIGIGGIAVGVESIHDESEFSFRLLAQGADIAAVHCEQYLHVENWQGGAGDGDIGSIIIAGNLSYLATLRCEAVGFHPDWPESWQLDLRAVDLRPFFGVLRSAQQSWSVAGNQQGSGGEYEASTGFEWRDGDAILARLNRLGDADLMLRTAGLALPERFALLAAAGALLQANDPLDP